MASLKRQGFKDIEPIWADDPETGLKKNIGPIIDRGLALCGLAWRGRRLTELAVDSFHAVTLEAGKLKA